jgi:hypothetical protein
MVSWDSVTMAECDMLRHGYSAGRCMPRRTLPDRAVPWCGLDASVRTSPPKISTFVVLRLALRRFPMMEEHLSW